MSPPAGDVPQTPDSSSSTTLLGAFRSLTGGRIRNAGLRASSSLATQRSRRTSSLGSGVPLAGSKVASQDGSMRTSQDANTGQATESITRSIVGGPPELNDLLSQLHIGRPFPERATAIQKLCAILNKYPIHNVLAIWSTASDLLSNEQPSEARNAGYTLLKSCASLPHLTPVERGVFFKAVASLEDTQYFDIRHQIIRELTMGGRNVEALESSMGPFLLKVLDSYFKASQDARRVAGKKRSLQPLKEEENLGELLHSLVDVIRFNAKVFDERHLELLLEKIMDICQKTPRKADIRNSIKMFDALITYTHIPKASLRPFVEVLCTIYRQIDKVRSATWNTLANLFRSHAGQAAVTALLDILVTGATHINRGYNIFRGAIEVLQLLLVEDGQDGLPKVSISLLLPALKASLKSENRLQETLVLRLIAAMFADERLKSLLLDEDWADLIYIIRTCAERSESSVTSSAAEPGSSNGTATAALSPGEQEPHVMVSATQAEADRREADGFLSEILANMNGMRDEMGFVQKEAVMGLFMRLAPRLSDTAAEHMVIFYVEQRYLHPSHVDWIATWRALLGGIFRDVNRPQSLRLLSIRELRAAYSTVEAVCSTGVDHECAFLILNHIEVEQDICVLNELVDFAVEVADDSSEQFFSEVIDLLRRRLEQRSDQIPHPFSAYPHMLPATSKDQQPLGSPCNVITMGLVRLFIRNSTKSAQKIRILYGLILGVAGSNSYQTDGRLTALRLLFRLRADSNHAITINSSSEGESIASVLCRTAETAVAHDRSEEHMGNDSTRHDDQASLRETRKASATSPHTSLSRHTNRQGNTSIRFSRPLLPLWMYPGPRGLPEEPSPNSSRVIFSHIEPDQGHSEEEQYDMEITFWLELVISLLQKAPDWEIYSYVLVHLGPQLANQALFRSAVRQVKMLRNVVCEQIRGSTFHEPPGYTLLKKADVAVCLIHVLTVLISYHPLYEKSEEDELVRAFLHGIGSWDRTSKWCIHALTVCCHEMPLSVSKSLDNIIQKMSQIITQPHIAIHILEFLTSLARMPQLYKNFREDEFKTVFGVSFRYLQYVRDQRERASAGTSSPNNTRTLRHSGASRDFSATQDHISKSKPKSVADDLPQYVYALAFHVITFWFMALKMPERRKQIPWITKNLSYTDRLGKEVTEEQSQVIMDMMQMVAYSERDETAPDLNFAKSEDGEVSKKTWIVGLSLMTIETAGRSGVSQITSRRACGTRYFYMRPLLTQPPRHQDPATTGLESFDTPSYVGLFPDDIFQSLYSSFNFASVPGIMSEHPIPLPEDDMSRRAIAAFDRIPTVDGHKAGVIYIGPGQTDEKEILLNAIGSPDYTAFLNDLGTLMRLKGAKFNTGGLDTHNDMDGEFTMCWRDRCMELVFHITTMMPTNGEDDLTYANKKRHIGNDFVNIIFNDSGLPYDFDTFPSAFNYVHIVITPESRASFVDRRLETDPEGRNRYYKVQVIPKPGFPEISPAAETKIISGRNLAAYVRLIAINASVFSQVWLIKEGGESVSSWRNRLREIKRLRERYANTELTPHASSPSSPLAVYPLSVPPTQGLSSPQSRESVGGFKRSSVATFISEGTSRSSLMSGSVDPE
ncbi:hypothetical protein GQ43DRAFT_438010 [Delitschia confertaspora ATCC 74209]|uniref:Rap-GAP domain-containing protein n=1 Tax=Delitschia confertaspora ATCC 74209 TaxID=1513339 RepID=A0A9P4JVU6_9PLEO|nr:hypothetical protein GQ43DRAFT_438010 [Delitschia confertaspora ATCC 74209]